jgi:L-asparaginase
MRLDPAAGGPVPALGGDALLAMAPGIERVAEVSVDEWAVMPGAHLTVEQMWDLRARIAEWVARPDVTGVVVTQGTDTIEETAYLVARSLRTDTPIVFTGAMRTSQDLSWDGPANITDAVRVASSSAARGLGVLVVFAGRIFSAHDVTKVDTHMLEAFDSPAWGALGVIDAGCVRLARALPRAQPVLAPARPATPVDIVYAYTGVDGRLLDAARAEGQGVVVAALGRGNTPPAFFAAIQRWIADQKPVVVTSRVPRGRVGPTYGFPGGGRTLFDAGAILAGSRRPVQARIDLMLALGAGLRGAALADVFDP